MKKEFIDFLSFLGITSKYLINGFIGGAIWAIHNRANIWDALRQIVIGGIVAGYCTDIIATRVDVHFMGFISFVIGIIGMALIDTLYKSVLKKIKAMFQ
jgi:hypothetical protein